MIGKKDRSEFGDKVTWMTEIIMHGDHGSTGDFFVLCLYTFFSLKLRLLYIKKHQFIFFTFYGYIIHFQQHWSKRAAPYIETFRADCARQKFKLELNENQTGKKQTHWLHLHTYTFDVSWISIFRLTASTEMRISFGNSNLKAVFMMWWSLGSHKSDLIIW